MRVPELPRRGRTGGGVLPDLLPGKPQREPAAPEHRTVPGSVAAGLLFRAFVVVVAVDFDDDDSPQKVCRVAPSVDVPSGRKQHEVGAAPPERRLDCEVTAPTIDIGDHV